MAKITPKEYAEFLIESTKNAKEESYYVVLIHLWEHIFDLKDVKDIENKKEYLSKVREVILKR